LCNRARANADRLHPGGAVGWLLQTGTVGAALYRRAVGTKLAPRLPGAQLSALRNVSRAGSQAAA